MLEELAEEEFVKEDSNADLALYLACGGLFVLVAIFIVSACIFMRYTIKQLNLCLFYIFVLPFKIIAFRSKRQTDLKTTDTEIAYEEGTVKEEEGVVNMAGGKGVEECEV